MEIFRILIGIVCVLLIVAAVMSTTMYAISVYNARKRDRIFYKLVKTAREIRENNK